MPPCILPSLTPDKMDAEVAELRAVQLFSWDFYRRYVFGIVLTQYAYMARTTAAPLFPGPLLFETNPMLTEVTRALTSDFRRWIRDRDYRKCDAMGIAVDSFHGELLEVTTYTNHHSAELQLRDKLDTLRRTVNRIHDLPIEWVPSPFKPRLVESFFPIPARFNDDGAQVREVRFVCYRPTQEAPPGVILYEIHRMKRLQPQEVSVPSETVDRLRRRFREFREALLIDPEAVAVEFARNNPEAWRTLQQALRTASRVAAGVGAAAMLAAAILAALDPAPGDEVPAIEMAQALGRYALRAAPLGI